MPENKRNNTPKHEKPRRLNRWRLVGLILLVLLVVGIGAGTGFIVGVVRNMPDWDPSGLNMAMTTFLYDSDGNQFETLHGVENRVWADFEDIPQNLKDAFLATEDNNFYEHMGVDPLAIGRAVLANIRSGWGAEGGSTITMQLAKNAFIENPTETSLKRKIREAVMAIELERTYSKDEIFEYYLNLVFFGSGANGVQAAAQTYFGKDVQDLTLAESATLAGLVQAPSYYNPFKNPEQAVKRRNQVLNNMVRYGAIDEATAARAAQEPLNLTERQTALEHKYPYFVDYVISEAWDLLEQNGIDPMMLYTGGLNVYTTLDVKVQQAIENAYADRDNFPPDMNGAKVQSAIAVIDVKTGEVRGLMGGREHTTARGLNRAVQPRQPGSSAKPLVVYGPALEMGYSPATVIDDVPATFRVGKSTYTPGNYDGRYRGLIRMREAIQWSVNIAAVKMLDTIGVEAGYQFGKGLGLPLLPSDKYLSMALGGWTKGASPLEMAAAYAAFGNQGIYTAPAAITKITDSQGNVIVEVLPEKKVAMSPQTAYLMTDMLQTVVTSGTGTRARLDRPVAGKTGTTQLPDKLKDKHLTGNTDAWWVAYTPELAAAVWMGFDTTDEEHYLKNVAGGSYPALIWKSVVSTALKGVEVKNFERPEGIVYLPVDIKSGLLPGPLTPPDFVKTEVFNSKNRPRETSNVWDTVLIDPATNQLATDYCPERVSKVVLVRPIPYQPLTKSNGSLILPEDANLEAPKEECQLHGPEQTVMSAVLLCTDPRHEGRAVLARQPGQGQSGGCPVEYLEQKLLAPGQVPTEVCGLEDHAVLDGADQPVEGTVPESQGGPPAPELSVKAGEGLLNNAPRIELEWTVNGGNRQLRYYIERWSDSDDTPVNLGQTMRQKYTDRDVVSGETYYYRVFAVDPDTNLSTPSATLSVSVQ